MNIVELDDLKLWHDFWIAIYAGGTSGTHVVQVWVDGVDNPQEFEVTAGGGSFAAGVRSYIQLSVGNTSVQDGAFDADYFYYKEGAYAPDGTSLTTDVAADGDLPQGFALYGNYPNPFNPTTEIHFAMKHRDEVNVSIYNAFGQLIETLVDGDMPAGMHTVTFTSSYRSSGIYFCRVRLGDKLFNKKMVLLK
jgi:hypothetical protein